MTKVAIITGATGQDGSYLSELLLENGYDVFCMIRRSTYPISSSNLTSLTLHNPRLRLFDADITDQSSVVRVFNEAKEFDRIEVYNLAAQSHVAISFECPALTVETNTVGTLNLLEAIRQCGLIKKVRFYQASTSEMFGKVQEVPQTEKTAFYPRSPYGVSKVAAHWMVVNYRESYGLFACCGILFNHESPRRGANFVTQKIVKSLCGSNPRLHIGNLDARRDWGHAKDYVKAMWLMLQQETPDDFVVSTGEQHSVREFIEKVCELKGIQLTWVGSGLEEIGVDQISGNTIVSVSEKFYRPCEVDTLLGDCTKIKSIGWKPEYDFENLVKNMYEYGKNATE
jgi:GDPmannose 4,6-dehydratase